MNLEWHYLREDKNDLPIKGSTVLIAEFIPGIKEQDKYYPARYRITMYEKFDLIIMDWWAKHFTYAWAYFEMPPLNKEN